MVRITTEDGSEHGRTVRSHAAKAYEDDKYGPIRNWTRGCLMRRGGMGEIFVGKNVENGQLFLIKSVARQPVWSRQLAALQNEEKILRKLSKRKCPNIFRTVGYATSESVAEMGGNPTLDLFLEFAMPRGNLREFIQRSEKLTESVAQAYTYQTLHALSCMHKNGIVHCDIRPINVIVCERGVKLGGFGLAKEVHSPRSVPAQRHPTHPQDIIDPPRECQEDISALGLVVCEMVTGRQYTIDQSSPVVKVLRSLEEDFGLKRSMPDCLSFIQSCLWSPSSSPGNETSRTTQGWTAERLLRHPWTASFETFPPSDLTSDEEGASLTPPLLSMRSTGETPAAAADSPGVTSLKKCCGKLCCRKMDTDAVVPPLNATSVNSSRRGYKLTRVLSLPQ